ncbi:MAG: dephospho-CoA kinase [Veillonellales bacterium]
MYIVGLTGGIASGKSAVSGMLREFGAYIVDADELARAVVLPKQPAWLEIMARFGPSILLPDGSIDREKLGDIVFNDKTARQHLEDIVHPNIKARVLAEIKTASQQGKQIVVLDVPLLFEVGWQKLTDEVWVVYVDDSVQLQRLIKRNCLSAEQALARIHSQMQLTEKVRLANVIIDNNGDLAATRRQVWENWQRLEKKTAMCTIE